MVSAPIFYCFFFVCVPANLHHPNLTNTLRVVIHAHITEKETETQNQLDLAKVTQLVIVLPSSQGFCFPVTTRAFQHFLETRSLWIPFPLLLISVKRSPSCHVQIFCYLSFIMYHPFSPVTGTKNKATLSQSRKFQ